MNRSDLIEYKLKPALNECHLHLQRLNYAANRIKGLFPLDKDAWLALNDENIAAIDQLLFRFGKLQDAMGLTRPAIIPNSSLVSLGITTC